MAYSANSSFTSKKSLVQSKVSSAGEYIRASGQIVGESVKDSAQQLADIPVSVNTSVRNFAQSMKKPADSNLVEHLGKLTGIESLQNLPDGFNDADRFINDLIKEGTGVDLGLDQLSSIYKKPTLENFKQRIQGTLSVLSDQVKTEILGCINAKLNELRNKLDALIQIPGINALDPSMAIRQLIAKHRQELQNTIRNAVNDLKYKKLKIQQIVLMRQKITEAINDICKDAPPSSRRKFQVDNFLKKVQDRVEENRKFTVHTGLQKIKTSKASSLVPVKGPVSGKTDAATPGLYGRAEHDLDPNILQSDGYTTALASSKTIDVSAEIQNIALEQSQGYTTKYIGHYTT